MNRTTDMPEAPEIITPTEPVVPPAGPLYTADDLAAARQQEKDKLYDRLTKQGTKLNAMEAEFQALKAEREALQQAEAARQAAEAEAARKAAEEEMSLRELLDQRDREYRAEITRLEQERAAERAILEKDRQFASLQAHIQRRVNEERENIAPELIDLITGNSPEEVEASISLMKAKTDAIAAKLGEASAALAANMRGVSATGYSADGPLDNQSASKTYSPQELGSMPMSEYAKHREALLNSASHTNRGLFG
ncbi:hypothetical protein AB0G15_05320 [Streptosporangium sp. NPDC023825]|uniref:hypothetical protein n=1 Tax=Streptosporangium sp. NPDC023825 TaxID=3154909 RepID=UPI003442F763